MSGSLKNKLSVNDQVAFTSTIGVAEKRVYKYIFEDESKTDFEVMMPIGASIISVQMQHGKVTMWYTTPAHPAQTFSNRKFRFIVTGFDTIPITAIHLATIQLLNGNYVVHLFEV